MTNQEFKNWKEAAGFSYKKLADIFGRSPRAVKYWASGETKIPHWVKQRIEDVRAAIST